MCLGFRAIGSRRVKTSVLHRGEFGFFRHAELPLGVFPHVLSLPTAVQRVLSLSI